VGVFALLVLSLVLVITKKMSFSEKPLHVWIPFRTLSAESKLIDPNNTATVYEYYLLENLASSIIQDSTEDPRGFEGIFVSLWSRPAKTQLLLTFKDNLKWSDGSPITQEDWNSTFLRLSRSSARHHVYLKQLKDWTWKSAQEVVLQFSVPIDLNSLLHELSLADSALISAENLNGDWSRTSGPYFVRAFDFEGKSGSLERSRFHPLFDVRPNAPFRVNIVDDWKSAEVFMLNSPATNPKLSTFEEIFSQKIDSAFSSILFLTWNPDHPYSRDREMRRQWMQWILSVQSRWRLPDGFKSENQMIPLGYAGRLETPLKLQQVETTALRGKEFVLGVWSSFLRVNDIWETLKQEASTSGFTVKVKTQEYWENDPATTFIFSSFRGNQKSAVGSWAFLMSDKASTLLRNDQAIQLAWNSFLNADSSSRESSLLKFHSAVLESGYLIPLASSFTRLYFTDRVSARRVNPFDLRLRFLDLE